MAVFLNHPRLGSVGHISYRVRVRVRVRVFEGYGCFHICVPARRASSCSIILPVALAICSCFIVGLQWCVFV